MAVVRLLKLNKPKSHILAVMPSHCHSYYSCAWSSCYSRLIPFCDLHLRSPLSLAYRLCRIQPRPFWLLLVTCRQQATHDGAGGCVFLFLVLVFFCFSPVSSCSLCLSSLLWLCVSCLLFFLCLFLSLPPLLLSLCFLCLVLSPLALFSLLSPLSLFFSPIFFEQAVVTTTKESQQGQKTEQKK